MNKYAYTTLLATDDYVQGVLGLNYSFQINNIKYPLIVLITDNCQIATMQLLEKNNIQYKIIPDSSFVNNDGRFRTTLNKFYAFTLFEYEKICFLDADVILSGNIDYIFNYKRKYWKYIPKEIVSIFGGCFVTEPSQEIFDFAMSYFDKSPSDEDVLNHYFDPNSFTWFKDDPIEKRVRHIGTVPKYWHLLHHSWRDIKHFININQGEQQYVDLSMLGPGFEQ